MTCRFPLQCLLYLAKKWKSLCTCLPLAQAGRGPKWKYPRIEPDENVIFVRAIKQRNQTGRLLGILEEVTWGEEKAVWQRIDKDGEGWHISTFCVERDNLTSRLHNSRLPAPSSARQAGLVRKTLRFSKQREMLEAAVALEDAYFKLLFAPRRSEKTACCACADLSACRAGTAQAGKRERIAEEVGATHADDG